jgi:uncharacterized integral membrane protein
MKPHVLLSLIGVLLTISAPSPVYVTFSGITIHFPLPLIAAAAVTLACLLLTLAVVRVLHGALRPHPYLRTAPA